MIMFEHVLYQMFLRLCLEVNSRMSSAESIMKYAGQGSMNRLVVRTGPFDDQAVNGALIKTIFRLKIKLKKSLKKRLKL